MSIMMDKIISSQLFPPGYDGERELKKICIVYGAAVVWSFQFFYRYYDAYKDLFYNARTMILSDRYLGMGLEHGDLLPGAKIQSFGDILSWSLLFFLLLILEIVTAGVMHYLYYRQGSRTILLIRRLPDRKYLWKTCGLGPMLAMAVCLVTIGVLLGLYYWIYVTMTPAVCLP